jgi:hypothetical protein
MHLPEHLWQAIMSNIQLLDLAMASTPGIVNTSENLLMHHCGTFMCHGLCKLELSQELFMKR